MFQLLILNQNNCLSSITKYELFQTKFKIVYYTDNLTNIDYINNINVNIHLINNQTFKKKNYWALAFVMNNTVSST